MKNFITIILCLAASLALNAQTTSKKPGTGAQATPAQNPKAVFDTTAGQLTCELFPKQAPKTVANFIGLAEGTKDWKNPKTGKMEHGAPLYNGTIFHRVIPNFMIQGGDPLGTGEGGPGYSFEDEFSPELKFDKAGVLAMANSGPNTDGSQFFITEVPNDYLDPCLDQNGCERGGRNVPKGYGYTIFGQCTPESVALVGKIARMATDPRNNMPYDPVKINKITIIGGPKPATAHKTATKRKTAPKHPAPKQK